MLLFLLFLLLLSLLLLTVINILESIEKYQTSFLSSYKVLMYSTSLVKHVQNILFMVSDHTFKKIYHLSWVEIFPGARHSYVISIPFVPEIKHNQKQICGSLL